jgi:magnesium-protoporphyrin IX monomethyl ester (oxidative) cyclase
MKILLVAPYVSLNYEKTTNESIREDFYPSAALLHLSAVLRANEHEPLILDLNNIVVHSQRENYLEYSKKIIIDNLNKYKPDLVGLNCLFSGVFPDVLKFARIIKENSPDLKIALGGIHATTFPKEILTNCNDIDFVALGEGENSIVALAASIKTGNENLLRSIKSFAYRDKDGLVQINREKNYIEDLNTLPMPAWDLINLQKFEMNLDHYHNPTNLPIKYKAAIFSSRACPLACNFCDMFLVMGKIHRKRSIKSIVDEIEVLNKTYGVNFFSFMDDQLTLNRSHILGLCDEILKRKIKMIFNTPNGLWVNSLREEVVAKMVETGLVYANLAIEHGDDHLRNDVIGKGLDRKKIFEVNSILKKYKVKTVGMFLMGFPEDTDETLQNSYDMMNELKLDNYSIQTVIPFPGTKLFKQVVKDKILLGDWKLDELWRTPIALGQYGQKKAFLIQPYNMSIDALHKWREKFDKIKMKYWTIESKKTKYGTPNTQSSEQTPKKRSALIYESI